MMAKFDLGSTKIILGMLLLISLYDNYLHDSLTLAGMLALVTQWRITVC